MALRFNGFSPVGANPWSAQCSSPVGNVSGVVGANANLRTLYGLGNRMNQRYIFGALASTPNATEPSTAWIMAEKGGDLACENTINQSNTTTNFVQMGINLEGSLAQDGSITAAALSMITSMSANMAASNSLNGSMQLTMNLAADLAQEGQISAALGLIAWCQASLEANNSVSASNLRGTQSMAASIVSYGDLTPEGIRDSVWGALLAQYQVAGSAGKALSAASSGGVDYEALAQAVWSHLTRTLTEGAAPTPEDVAAAVLVALQGASPPIPVDVKQMNSAAVIGTGQEADKWRGVGVPT